MANAEYQKPFSKIGQLNAEIVTNKSLSAAERDRLKRKVNELMGRKFYTDIPGESHE